MKIPKTPPKFADIFEEVRKSERFMEIASLSKNLFEQSEYLHWDDMLRKRIPPEGFTFRECWFSIKLSRINSLKSLPLLDKKGVPFKFAVPDLIQTELHQIDLGAGGLVTIPEQITNKDTRDRFLVNSLLEEAITSSQMEGAVTTRAVAKEMIRSGRKPRDTSERMIHNNYLTMQRIGQLRHEPLSPLLIFELHQIVTDQTLEDSTAAGRLRREDEYRVVGDDSGQIFHEPPDASELSSRLGAMCDFANSKTPGYFIHPAVRAILLHFWLAYDHPFVDGNGRTARALFYWAMLRQGYWLFEYISISSILRKGPAKYGRSFLHSETDENDATYFVLAQTQVIRQAIQELHLYIEKKTAERRQIEGQVSAMAFFNHRQVDLLRHALANPNQIYSFSSHQKSHGIAYQTARTDVIHLADQQLLEQRKKGKQMVFMPHPQLAKKLESYSPFPKN